jgi:DNA-binding transcriptional ArsR family regulator
MKSWIPLAAALVALATVAGSSAAASSGEQASVLVTSGVPIRIAGEADWSTGQGVLAARGASGSLDLGLAHQGAIVETVTITTHAAFPSAGAPTPVDQTRSSRQATLAPGTLGLVSRGDDFALHALGSQARMTAHGPSVAPRDVWTQANAWLTVPLADEIFRATVAAHPVPASSTPIDEGRIIAGATVFRAEAARAQLTTDSMLLAAGSLLQDGQVFAARTQKLTLPGGVYAGQGQWVGPGDHQETRVSYLVVTPTAGRLAINVEGASLSAAGDSWRLTTDGMVQLPWADGTVRHSGQTTGLHEDQTLIGGRFTWAPLSTALEPTPALRVWGQGELTYLRVGGLPATISNAEVAVLATGALVGAAAVGAAFWYWPLLKFMLAGAVAPLYARVAKEHVLDHKGRELVYELVKAEPGISTNRLAARVEFGWSTLTYHLRVLERNEAIVSVRDGRYKRFFDRRSGRYANGRKNLVSVLKNDATLDIAKFILEHPGVSQKEVGEAFSLAPSSVHWHVTRLSEADLVNRARQQQRVRYFPGPAWAEIDARDVGLEASLLATAKDAGPTPAPDRPVNA